MNPDTVPPVPVLIVSCRPQNRKSLASVFSTLPVDCYSVPTLSEAREILANRDFRVVFCEERLPDGPYSELLATVRNDKPETRFVVMICFGEWDEYLHALRLGASEVLRCPMHSTDIDLAMIHAMRSSHSTLATASL